MPVYTKLTIIYLLFLSIQVSPSQTDTFIQNPPDSIPLNNKYLKYEVAILPITLYYVPSYFNNTNKVVPVVGLQFKYFVSKKNAFRLSYCFNGVIVGKLRTNFGGSGQNTKQYSIGFQHTVFRYKNFSTYLFADFYFQTFTSYSFADYSSWHYPTSSTYITYDSAVHYAAKVYSYNLVSGVGFKFLDRQHVFVSVEAGLGLSYYTSGTQQATGTSTTNIYSIGTQQSYGSTYYNQHQLPQVNTKVTGINLNASLIRLAIGFIF
ncbi:MAG TPA: hypothetical protein VNX01_00560 [Bacteroidia bacterium]|nr:hypothetical protein [Bacteroidia bacterium]